MQKPQEQADRLPPPRTLILDFTLTHPRYYRSLLNPNGQLTNTSRSDGSPKPDGDERQWLGKRLFIIVNSTLIALTPSPLCRLQLTLYECSPWSWHEVSTAKMKSFMMTSFVNVHREASANDIPEESGQFCFLPAACLPNLKGSVGLILAKASDMRIYIPLDLSSRSFIPLPCFIRSRRPWHTTFNPFPCSLSSTSWKSGTCWVFMLEFRRLFYSS